MSPNTLNSEFQSRLSAHLSWNHHLSVVCVQKCDGNPSSVKMSSQATEKSIVGGQLNAGEQAE